MNSYEKLMAKKKKGNEEEMSPELKQAKMGILEHLRDLADQHMGEKLHDMKKVSVASDSKEGLAAGLEKAKDMVEGSPEEEASESHEEEMAEDPEKEAMEQRNHMEENEEHNNEHADLSEEEIDKKLEELMKLKEALSAKKM